MPYNEALAIRIRNAFYEKNIVFTEKKMFSGICFMVDDKMCCGTHVDKKNNEDVLLCRIGENEYEKALEIVNCIPMEFTGKPMKGYVYVTENGIKSPKDLEHWLQLCLDFNPLAKKSKK
ncbi:TfoX/Sxy family protein [Flavobacterium sp.]|uniref:TfoX/Sxy family protein n=1 Tax=Flavobacterium sp. TaxID=239 RepID=UPI002B4AFDB6|nr:TfoX/Sxy family protein [Flavobacterium sp.]HLP64885.1 TfoX/Sxy family protein [Flavobacterium sp.]